MQLVNKANKVKNLGIASIILLIFGILFIVGTIVYNTFFADSNNHNASFNWWWFGNVNITSIIFAIGIVLIVIAALLWFIGALKILFSNWQNPKIQTSRVIWGLLSLFLLGPIAVVIFGSKAQKIASVSQSTPPVNLNPL